MTQFIEHFLWPPLNYFFDQLQGVLSDRMIQKGQIIGAKNHLSTFEHFSILMAA
ncbi:hypothetical protein [Cardinium endosymbiont of Oedothorax gibbosus]|uniref:hypothetical protein n=1 Tax=Cardinium endosymbiont of Oedothorax gibbosus TaxID=931101 RepID=UPI002024B1C0|nr:hypothetical protein [Cardinium endosymbiont of Oedothorax gibbosus]